MNQERKLGCDTHFVVESKRYNEWWAQLEKPWTPRHYGFFGAMSDGVRGFNGFPPKGLPHDMTHSTFQHTHLRVADFGEVDDGSVTQKEAMSFYGVEFVQRYNRQWITHPDLHSHTYLSTLEFEACINKTEIEHKKYGLNLVEYRAILSYMQTLELTGMESRVIVWFDN